MFYDATLYMSNSKFVTLSSSIPIYNSLLEHLEKLVDVNDKNYCNSSEVRIAILKDYKKLKTYYLKTDDSHTYAIATSNYIFSIFFLFDLYILYNCFFLIYYVSIVIDPWFKLGYYQKQEWEQYDIDAAKKYLLIHSKIFIKIILMMLTTEKTLMTKVIFSLIYWKEITTTIIMKLKHIFNNL